MSNLSFQNIISELTNYGFKINKFTVSTKGSYSQLDVDWNYKDIMHLDHVHSHTKSYIPLNIGKKSASYISFQKIPLIGITVPVFFLVYEHSAFNQIHFTNLGSIILVVDLKIVKNGKQTTVNSQYALATKGIYSLFTILLKKITLRKYYKLLAEDTPLREQRAQLREVGHDFIKQGETYDYDHSAKINQNNVTLLKGTPSKITTSISQIIKNQPNKIGTNKGVLSFFLTYNQNIQIWPTTCSHEGANITKACIRNEHITCPWHGRKIKPIIELTYDGKIVSTNEQVYKLEKYQDDLEIFFNN